MDAGENLFIREKGGRNFLKFRDGAPIARIRGLDAMASGWIGFRPDGIAPSNVLIAPDGTATLIDFDGFVSLDPSVPPPDRHIINQYRRGPCC